MSFPWWVPAPKMGVSCDWTKWSCQQMLLVLLMVWSSKLRENPTIRRVYHDFSTYLNYHTHQFGGIHCHQHLINGLILPPNPNFFKGSQPRDSAEVAAISSQTEKIELEEGAQRRESIIGFSENLETLVSWQ